MNETEIIALFRSEIGLEGLPSPVLRSLAKLTELLIQGNERQNLTAIRDHRAIARLHWADSLALLRLFPELVRAARAADVGSGAGIPALPLAAACPEAHWTAIESVGRKCRFISDAAEALGLPNVTVICSRAEDVARTELRESFDIAVARAVGPVASLLEVGLPLVRTGGNLLLYKTAAAEDELQACDPVAVSLGGAIREVQRYSLEGDEQSRAIFRVEKCAPTPTCYPRRAGMPFKRPLG